MSKDLVSIIMAVYNGETFLAQALDSLLAQDHLNIEIIILDNISTDKTPEICCQYAAKDNRIRFMCDKERVDGVEGQKRATEHVRGEYVMIACDDDVYHPSYISRLLKILKSNPETGLAFSGFDYIFPDGSKIPSCLKKRYYLKKSYSQLYNFAFYLLHRYPVPVIFGLMKTEIHKKALASYRYVDQKGGDHDNLYVLKLLSLAKTESTEEILMSYRQKDRLYTWPAGLSHETFKKYFGQIIHQFMVSKAVLKIINEASFSYAQKLTLHCSNILICLFYCTLKFIIDTKLYHWFRHVWK